MIDGEVVSRRWVDNDWGGGWKISIAVDSIDGEMLEGELRAWGTAPTALEDDLVPGEYVKLTATLRPRGPGRCDYSRPTVDKS